MDYLPQFKLWLKAKNYSDSTSRNYLADLGKYLNYVNHLPQHVSLDPGTTTSVHIFSPDILSLYVSYLTGKNNSSRYLASLNQFCQFAVDQHLITTNPLKTIHRTTPTPNISEFVSLYEQHLTKHNTPISTIRNYINDLHQYISWLETQPNQNPPTAKAVSSLEKGGLQSKKYNFLNRLPFFKGRSRRERGLNGLI